MQGKPRPSDLFLLLSLLVELDCSSVVHSVILFYHLAFFCHSFVVTIILVTYLGMSLCTSRPFSDIKLTSWAFILMNILGSYVSWKSLYWDKGLVRHPLCTPQDWPCQGSPRHIGPYAKNETEGPLLNCIS